VGIRATSGTLAVLGPPERATRSPRFGGIFLDGYDAEGPLLSSGSVEITRPFASHPRFLPATANGGPCPVVNASAPLPEKCVSLFVHETDG